MRFNKTIFASLFALIFILFFVYSSNAAVDVTTITGKLICIGCELKHSDGVAANCKLYGHKHGLKTTDGKIYSFIENDKSTKLINTEENHDKNVEIIGKVLKNANFIDVEKFSVLCDMCNIAISDCGCK